jgi:hypothetical protein
MTTQSATISEALLVLAPGAIWNLLDANDYSTCVWMSPDIPQPSQAEVDAEIATLNQQAPIDDCKKQASELLYETDWTTIPDITDPTKSNPYLGNQADYIVYRNALRQLAVYPVANPVWPAKPTTVWVNV